MTVLEFLEREPLLFKLFSKMLGDVPGWQDVLKTYKYEPTWSDKKLGFVSYKRKVMGITKLDISRAQRMDTIAHEVAHILAAEIDGARGHGPMWQMWAMKLNADPSTYADDEQWREAAQEVRDRKYKVVMRCVNCGREWKRTRLVTERYRNARCRCGATIQCLTKDGWVF